MRILHASDDYEGICLLIDLQMTIDTPVTKEVLWATYHPLVEQGISKVTLTPTDASHLHLIMQEIRNRIIGKSSFKEKILKLLFAVFILDLTDAQNRSLQKRAISERSEELFFAFIHLIPENYANHHDIGFYADHLSISPTYLSRVVKQMTGRTVMDILNQMLLREASWLLVATDLSIGQIADRLNFSDQASFSKFFTRLKGIPPKEYRTQR